MLDKQAERDGTAAGDNNCLGGFGFHYPEGGGGGHLLNIFLSFLWPMHSIILDYWAFCSLFWAKFSPAVLFTQSMASCAFFVYLIGRAKSQNENSIGKRNRTEWKM
jgi:hypothetical protein